MKISDENTVFKGKIGEIVQSTQPDGRVFEQYRRSPGTRLVIISTEGKMLITRELRIETNSYDLRLPGGKVCDTLKDYEEARNNGSDVLELAKKAAKKEALEEAGIQVNSLKFITKANAGATVEWDLYYFLVTDYSEHPEGQQLEAGEEIEVLWMTPAEIRKAILDGKMHEWRSVGVLLGLVLPGLELNN